ILPHRSGIHLRNHLDVLGADLRLPAFQTDLSVSFPADPALGLGDAIVRTLMRLFVTHRRLLEWTTAAQSKGSPRLDLRGFYRKMTGGVALGLVLPAGAIAFAPPHWPLVLPFALLWLAAPALALWSSRSPTVARRFA